MCYQHKPEYCNAVRGINSGRVAVATEVGVRTVGALSKIPSIATLPTEAVSVAEIVPIFRTARTEGPAIRTVIAILPHSMSANRKANC